MKRFVALGLALALGTTSGHAADRQSLIIRGVVVDGAGWPMAQAQVFLEGTRTASTKVNAQGAFTLTVSVPDWTSLERTPLTVWLDAGRSNWGFQLANGQPALRLEVDARRDSAGGRRSVVRSNDAAVTARLARGVSRRGILRDTIEVRFIGTPGADPGFRELPMSAMEEVVVPAIGSAAAAAGSTARKPSASVATKPESSSPKNHDTTKVAPVTAATTMPQPEPAPAASAPALADTLADMGTVVRSMFPPRDSCICRIEGTVEVNSNQPLPDRTPIVVWLEDNPAMRDSIELFMGSPRRFELTARGCGNHRVMLDVRSRLRFNQATPDPVVECTGLRTRQVRIILVPAGR